MPNILHRQENGPHLSVKEIGQELQRLGARPLGRLIGTEQSGAIAPQRRDQRISGCIELAQIIGTRLWALLREAGADFVENADAPLEWSTHQREIQIVDV